MRKPLDLSLYLVLDPDLCAGYGLVETTLAAVRGGVTVVQLRDKRAGTAGLVEAGRALKAALAGADVALVVNDDVEAAVALQADGLHIGQDDMDAAQARRRIGPAMALGLSVETPDLAGLIDPAVVDYAGAGPVFATATTPGHKEPVGFHGLAEIVAVSPVPAVAIGGLKVEHARAVFAAGAAGLSVVSAICGQPDPEAAARRLADAIRETRA